MFLKHLKKSVKNEKSLFIAAEGFRTAIKSRYMNTKANKRITYRVPSIVLQITI